MDIVATLILTSALIGAFASMRFNAFVLVPVAILIALASATILHRNDFGPWSGIATIIACLIVNQAAYIIVQIFNPADHLLSKDVADSKPSPRRQQAVHDDDNDGD